MVGTVYDPPSMVRRRAPVGAGFKSGGVIITTKSHHVEITTDFDVVAARTER
jgi:hypothetical protein